MLSRRDLLVASTGAAATLVVPAHAQFPADLLPPGNGLDAYGMTSVLGKKTYFEEVLRALGEPAILPQEASVSGATFRLTESYSLRRPRAARIIFFQELEPKAVSINKDYGIQTASDAKPLTTLRYFSGQDASRLRLLIDDEERFWDASSIPPDWEAIVCKARKNNPPCAIVVDGGDSLLEGRIGAKRHAILRHNPHATSLVQQLAREVF